VSRVALVSGASRGIGRAIAEALARDGWRLSLGARDPDSVAVPQGSDAQVQAYEARHPDAGEAWVAAAMARFGRIDAVVANAGIMVPKSVIEAEDADFDDLLEVNVKAPRRLVKAAWEPLAASGRGRVVVVASLSGLRVASAGSGLYATSKFAAVGLVHALRQAGWARGIRATAVCPGFVATDMAAPLTQGRDPAELTQPADVARAVAFALSLPNTASVAELPINWNLEPRL
jgi:NAD(P)-dependent dehydrogenase (short-subunit alcohol dehydrogenase family)